jgi:hypothetical protein
MQKQRLCVFCGQRPAEKTREHILPEWLLEMTGDPTRTAVMGFNPDTGMPIVFAWSALTMPACDACNNRYSKLEDATKPVVRKILKREMTTASEVDVLLDWLDKVRICIWLHQVILQKRVGVIDPKLCVDNRIRLKDRMIAVYALPGLHNGLNAIGIETLVFQHQPSCFALRINDVVLLNASADYVFAARCGFLAPLKRERILDGESAGTVRYSDWQLNPEIRHPILEFELPPPDWLAVQPIVTLEGQSAVGQILEQRSGHVETFSQAAAATTINNAAQERLRSVAAATFRYQVALMRGAGDLVATDLRHLTYAKGMQVIFSELNELRAMQVELGILQGGAPDQATVLFKQAMDAARVF